MAEKKNLFGSYGMAVDDREQEQKKTEAAAKGGSLKKRGEGATTMTLSISQEDKRLVKEYAARNATSVSDLLHGWINQYCKG